MNGDKRQEHTLIKELRAKIGLSQKKFGERYNIPMRTISNWELGISTPPKYVEQMLARIVSLEDCCMASYVFVEYRRNAKIGTKKLFCNEDTAVDYAVEKWNSLSEAEQNTYIYDDAIFEVALMPVEWNNDTLEYEAVEGNKSVIIDLIAEK